MTDRAQRGHVVLLSTDGESHPDGHDAETWQGIAERLAVLLGHEFSSWYEPAARYRGPVYFIPLRTLLSQDCDRLGITSDAQLFGGVVPHRFVATKVITHPALAADSQVPPGWSHDLAVDLSELVLPGISAFCRDDAVAAAKRLLADGEVRVKPAWFKGGGGQRMATSLDEAIAALDELDQRLLELHGVVIERNLAEETTYSVGQVRCGGMTLSYVGTQRQTRNNAGHVVYGGSDLICVSGGMDGVDAVADTPAMAMAVAQARRYDRAVAAHYRPFFASRRNYDVIQGVDARGRPMSGVLEQSWRAGGASPAEIEALRSFAADPLLACVRASSREVYGAVSVPDDADVYFSAVDPAVGLLTKYSRVDARGHSR